MWRMHDGDRVLTNPEWAVFALGLDPLRAAVEDDLADGTDDAGVGVPVFDRLTPEQKLALLADTATALRDPEAPAPHHTAANEGAIAAVLAAVRDELVAELDLARVTEDDPPAEVRRLLLAACAGPPDREGPLADLRSTSCEEWGWLLEEVEERVLWDCDYDLGDTFLDLPPGEARVRMAAAGIDPEYFLAVPPDPGEVGLTAARQALARLLGLPVPGDDGLYPALVDLFHDLTVGPCGPAEAAAWGEHPWVQVIGMTEPGWDCDYPTWLAAFGPAVPAAPFELTPPASGGSVVMPAGVRVEPHGDGWVVRDECGSYWYGEVDNGWVGEPDDEDVPPLSFPSAAQAAAAYTQADRMYADRAVRRRAALARLGRPDDD